MTYTTGIPRAGQSLGNSRPQIQNNFDIINTAFAINHLAFGVANQGKHKYVQMPRQAAGPSTSPTEGALYTKLASGITNLFFRQEDDGTEIQMTNIEPLLNTKGYTFLPGGLLLQWGQETKSNGSTTDFPIEFSSIPFSITTTIFQNSSNRHFVYVRSVAKKNFVTSNLDGGGSGETNTFKWMAIGLKV